MAGPEGLAEKISNLISEELAGTGGGFVTGFYLIAEYVDHESRDGWLYATPDNQTLSRTTGLVEWARGVARYEQQRHLEDVTDE